MGMQVQILNLHFMLLQGKECMMTWHFHAAMLESVVETTGSEFFVAGIIDDEQPQMLSSLREDISAQQFGITIPYASPSELKGQIEGSVNPLLPAPLPLFAKRVHGTLHKGVDSSVDGQIRNGRPRIDARGKSQLLPRYWPRFTDEELQQISGKYPLYE
jgi:hypothetical protein